MTTRDSALEAATADHILFACGAIRAGERVALIADEETFEIAELFADRAEAAAATVVLCRMKAAGMHGAEPAPDIARAMLDADLIVGLTKMSLAHTRARMAATDKGARYLSMPDYSWDLLSDPSLRADFVAAEPEVRRVADILSAGSRIRVTNPAGTDIELDVSGRYGNACPGSVREPGMLGSPPDIEANIAPIEQGSNGQVVVDGSIPCREIGLLSSPITLGVRDGNIVSIDGDREISRKLNEMFDHAGASSRVLAEFGIGLNRAAKLQGNMLTDEGAFGCIHFGFGSNATIGGQNEVSFHLDFVFRNASFAVDGTQIMNDGTLVT